MKTKMCRLIKMGGVVKDSATGLKGTVRVIHIDMDDRVQYLVQPRGLNDDGQPVNGFWAAGQRLSGGGADMQQIPWVLGGHLRDTITGFAGMAVGLYLHESGCTHVDIQPPGTTKAGDPVPAMDFDIRRLKGKALEVEKPEKVAASKAEKPSPSGAYPSPHPRMP
jgi:hypothetical protein